MSTPVVDITTLYAVESLFRSGTRDPWGRKLAGRLADFFIFSEEARFTMPMRAEAAVLTDPSLPALLTQLRLRDSGVFAPLPFVLRERRTLKDEYLEPAFRSFSAWATNNTGALKRWLAFHNEIRASPDSISHIRPTSVFDIGRLLGNPEFRDLCGRLGLRTDDVVYAFDIVLRYPLYGEIAGNGSYFLAHPIREQQGPPIITVEAGQAPTIPMSLGPVVSEMASSMTLDQYTSFLHEARGLIRDRQIHRLQAGAIDREATREIAIRLNLPARLSNAGKMIGFGAGIIGIAGAVPALSPAVEIAGGLVSMFSAMWTGSVGTMPGRVKWLRWALEWDLERQGQAE